MVSIARRNLFSDKGRLFISIGGVAFAVLLIGILLGLYRGWDQVVTSYIRSTGADLWVRQAGSADLFHSVSYLPTSVGDKLRSIQGVSQATPFRGRTAKLNLGGEDTLAYLVGYDTKEGIGGPARIKSGAASPGPGQIIVDRSLAASKGLRIGQRIPVMGRELEVAGISDGGNMLMYSFNFLNLQDAEELLAMKGLASYYLVKVSDRSQVDAVIQRIGQQVPGVEGITTADFAEGNRKSIDETFLPVIFILVLIGFGVGVVVIGLTIYTATMEKSREYGVLKALGASNGRLYRIVFGQALIAGVLGYVLGAALTIVVGALAGMASPMFVTSLSPAIMVGIFGLALLMSLAASYFPVSRLVRIDPAIVFRS